MKLVYILLPLIVSVATQISVPAAKVKVTDKIAIPEPPMDPKKGVFCVIGGYYPYRYYNPYYRCGPYYGYRPYIGYGPYRFGPYYRYWG